MKWEFNQRVKNGPSVINCEEHNVTDHFKAFRMEMDKKESITIKVKQQLVWLEEIVESIAERDLGWSALLCGNNIEQLRLMAYTLCSSATERKIDANWINIPSYRATNLRDYVDVSRKSILVIDSLLIYPEKMEYKEEKTTPSSHVHDFVRTANVFDLWSMSAGKHSTIILCPGVTPDIACKMSYLKPNFMFHLDG